MSYLLAFLALGLLILVHEAGHMWVARLSGMRVDKFSVFFGPPLLRWRGKATTYQIATVPLGGFVQIAGMNPHEQIAPDDPGSYQNKSVWRRFATVAAGPGINYIFAMLLMAFVLLVWGKPIKKIAVAEVKAGTPAAAAGIRSGDVIERIGGEPMAGTGQILTAIHKSKGKPIRLLVDRKGQKVPLDVTPRPEDGGYKIGIYFGQTFDFDAIGAGRALILAIMYPFIESARVLGGLKRLAKRETSAKMGGPLEIVRQLKMSFEQSFVVALLFMAMLNVLLGLFNLLPLPALDGGRLIFLVTEMVSRRPVNRKVENGIHMVGFILLLGLLLIVTFRDIQRLLFQ